MSKVLLIIAIISMALPSFARRSSRKKVNQYAVVESQDLKILEELYDITVTRASDLSCFVKKPDIFDRILKNKRYKRHKLKRKNNDLCKREYIRIEAAADNLDAFNDIVVTRRSSSRTILAKVSLTRKSIVADIKERDKRMSDLACHTSNSNKDLCKVEDRVISFIEEGLLPIVNKQMKQLFGYNCHGIRACR